MALIIADKTKAACHMPRKKHITLNIRPVMDSYIESLKYPTSRGKMVEDDFGKRRYDNICMINEQSKMSYRQVIFLTLLFLRGLKDLSYRTQKFSVHKFCDETGQFYSEAPAREARLGQSPILMEYGQPLFVWLSVRTYVRINDHRSSGFRSNH